MEVNTITKTTATLLAVAILLTFTAGAFAAQVGPSIDVGDDTYYISDSGAIYKEDNGCDGLQEGSGDCDGDGKDDGPDERKAP